MEINMVQMAHMVDEIIKEETMYEFDG